MTPIMVRKKPVKSLKEHCLKVIPVLLKDHIRRMANKTANFAKWFGVFEGNLDSDKDELLRRQVVATREFVFGHVIWYDYEEVFKALGRGVEEAIAHTRKTWKMSTNMEHYRKEMEAMAAFTDVVLFPHLRKLEFINVPTSLRARVVEKFHLFQHLRVLDLSSESGGQWLFKNTLPAIIRGLEVMHRLEHFYCKRDANAKILEALSKGCSQGLKSLDVEGSKGVNSDCVQILQTFTALEQINLFNTKMEDEGKAKLLLTLTNLVSLVRGDFLCEALEWIDYLEDEREEEAKFPQLLLTEFFPSQNYFFHEEWQLEMASRMCPFISRMLFIFHETCVESYLVLASFEYLTHLDVFGGCFFQDKLKELLEVRGTNLKRLNLISVRNVSYLALAFISQYCPNLESFSLSNCELGDYAPRYAPNSDEEYNRWHNYLRMTREAMSKARTMPLLEDISLQSSCRATYLTFLLSKCPAVKVLQLGHTTLVSDEVISKVYEEHGFEKLEEFHCERSVALTKATLDLLVDGCENLKSVSDIQNWAPGLSAVEVGEFRHHCFEHNLALDTSSHRSIRRYLEMGSSERKSYLNLVAGPTLERIRMAERERGERYQEGD